MNLNHLRCLVILAEELNFRRAADRLALSQPHLTRLIAQLETELGVQLLRRTTRQVKLTVAGAALVQNAQEILIKTEETVHLVQAIAAHEVGSHQ